MARNSIARRISALHRNEEGPNTVEWVLLVTVGLIVLVGIYFIAQWALGGLKSKSDKVNTEVTNTNPQKPAAMP